MYQLAEGDPIKAKEIWRNLTYEDCVKFTCMKQYRALTESEAIGNGRR